VSLCLYDAHNHLHDERFAGRQEELLAACAREGVARMVVNGSCEEDWPQVLALAQAHPVVLPSFGYHPWYVRERSPDWLQGLTRFLGLVPGAVGEIGLDRWKPGLSYEGQEEVFVAQLRLAAERDLPVSIHCLQAWGRLFDLLREHVPPRRGFLLHSYGGPQEMVAPLARLGAYFGLPGYFAHERKARQRETFKHVPPDRLLIETDAPDQALPEMQNAECRMQNVLRRTAVYALTDPASGKPLNHPANIRVVYEFAAGWLHEPVESLAARVQENFLRLFAGL
jgi:TatD DNase family protein